MVLAWEVVDREAPRHRLLIERVRIALERVRLAGLGLTLGPDHVLDSGDRQELAELGRVEHVARANDEILAG